MTPAVKAYVLVLLGRIEQLETKVQELGSKSLFEKSENPSNQANLLS